MKYLPGWGGFLQQQAGRLIERRLRGNARANRKDAPLAPRLADRSDLTRNVDHKVTPWRLRLQNISIDSRDPSRLAGFWADVLGWRVTSVETEEVVLEPPVGSREEGVVPDLVFLRVPDDKAVKNRLHLDLRPSDQVAEVERLTGLGADARRRRTVVGRDLGRARGPRGQRVLRAASVQRRRIGLARLRRRGENVLAVAREDVVDVALEMLRVGDPREPFGAHDLHEAFAAHLHPEGVGDL